MNIFFAYSSRGNHEDQDIYVQLAEILRQYGRVYSERFGDVETTDLGHKERHVEIFKKECELLKKSDILVAEVSEPSLGVGYEIALALEAGKKVLCLFRQADHSTVSSMIAGNRALIVRQYESMMDVDRIMRNL